MNKLFGAALVLAAGVWARWTAVAQRRRRRDMLASLCAALRCMGEEIRITRLPMPELLDTLGARYPDGAGAFFRRAAAGIGRGQGLGEAWQQAAEELPLLFERFHKSDKSRSEDKDGYGLGLYIVKTILEQHKEKISVTSEDGVTAFSFSLATE